MATRSEIYGPDGKGRYHHWDGYPSGVGKTLWKLYHEHFGKDVNAMRRVLLEEHPAGWSTINVDTWGKIEPGFVEFKTREKDPEQAKRPQCYCHGDRNEDEDLREVRIGKREDGSIYLIGRANEEYAYILADDALHVYESPKNLLGVFPWSGNEPDWKSLG